MNLKREVWEGWTVENFIDELDYLVNIIMNGQSIQPRFQTKEELIVWLRNNQPSYKKDIPEVIEYFTDKYDIK